MKRTTILGVILSILLIIGMPFTSSVMTIQKETDDDDPEYYEVTRYNLRGLTYDKEIIRVSYEDAMAIKDAFEGIDSSFGEDKIERKKEVLFDYGLIDKDNYLYDKTINYNHLSRSNTNLINFNQEKYYVSIFSFIDGFFGPSVSNVVNFFVAAPLFISVAVGINVRIIPFLVLPKVDIVTNELVLIQFVAFMGLLLVIPFISPGGYIMGFYLFGDISALNLGDK